MISLNVVTVHGLTALGSIPLSIVRSVSSAQVSASARRRNVLLIYFPLRRTWARQFPEGSLTITGIRVHSYLKSCAIFVQQGNETSLKGGKSRDKNCARSHLFA